METGTITSNRKIGDLTETNPHITEMDYMMIERTLCHLINVQLPKYQKDDLDKLIESQAYLLGKYMPLYKIALLKELIEKEDMLFIPIEAFRYGLKYQKKYDTEMDCLYSYFCEVQSTDTAKQIEKNINSLYNNIFLNISHIRVVVKLLQDYLCCCQQRYSFMQKNIHLFLNLGYENINKLR